MKGDDRTRHCDLCELNVHNVAGLSAGEVQGLVATSDGRLCARLFRRVDGTVITRDCPVGLRKYRKRLAGIASTVFAAFLSLLSTSYAQKEKDSKKVDASEIKIVRTEEKTGASTIRGAVVDPMGAVIPNAELELVQNGKTVSQYVRSDADGEFNIGGLREGIYEIRIRAAHGFQALRVKNIDLKTNEKLEMDLELSVDSSVELIGVIVTSDSVIDLSTNEQKTVFTREMLDRMPGRKPPFD